MTRTIARLTLAALLLTPLAASAQTAAATTGQKWYAVPFLGMTFGGDTTKSATTVGVAAGWRGAGRLGGEADIAWTPGLFEQDGFLANRSAVTVMGNAVAWLWADRAFPFQPYASGGLGLVRLKLSQAGWLFEIDEQKLGYNVGAGLDYAIDRVGIRGDVRYFRTVGEGDGGDNLFGVDASKFGFWRASVGLKVRF